MPNKKYVVAGKKAAKKRKGRAAGKKAHATYVNSRIFTKVKLRKEGYRSITFESKKGYEYKGVVDLVAIKRDNKRPDRLEIIFFQMKGGSARVTDDELSRLEKAVKNVKISWNVAEKKERSVKFRYKIK